MSREENQNKIIEELYKEELINGILEMARVGYLPVGSNKSQVEVYVHTDDPGKTPHFHVRKKSEHGHSFEWDKCIQFEKAEYFEHGDFHKGKLPNKKYVKMVIDLMKSVNKTWGITYWQYAVRMWNDNNSDVTLPDDLQMPDYSRLKVGK